MPRKKRMNAFYKYEKDFDEDDESSQSSKNGQPPIQRNAANARERARMRVLSSAFGRLKTKLPNIPPDTKLSKLDTLRLATMYIKQLKSVVEGTILDGENINTSFLDDPRGVFGIQNGSQSMNWPFGFHHIPCNSRQLSLSPSTGEWSRTNECYTKYPRFGSTAHSTSRPHWKADTLIESNSTMDCVFESLTITQPNQNQCLHDFHQEQIAHSHENGEKY